MTQNGILLKEWAENEIGFHGKGPVDWEGLCTGSLFRYWSHLISRVKSKKRAAKQRSDFRHQIQVGESLSELQSDMKVDEERRKRVERVGRKASLMEAIGRKKQDIAALHESQSWQTKKISSLIDVVKDYKRDFEEVQKRQAYVLLGFVKEIQEETQRIRKYRVELQESQRGILRWSSSEKQFATKDGSIESHGQRAINQGIYCLKTRFHSITSSSQRHNGPNREFQRWEAELLASFGELGAGQISSEFPQAFLLANKDLRDKVGRIDLRKDALRIQSELEKNNNGLCLEEGGKGRRGVKCIESLVRELTKLHATSGREAKRNHVAIADLETKNREKLQAISKELDDEAGSQSKMMLRNIELEMNYIKLSGVLKKLSESIAHNQGLAKAFSDEGVSKENYLRIAKQAEDIAEAQHDISSLISHNRSFTSRLDGLISKIQDYKKTELRERASPELVKLLKSLENQFTERYEDFKTLPIQLFSCTEEGSIVPRMSNLESSKMSIHGLINGKAHPSHGVVSDLLKELNLPSSVATGKRLLPHVMELNRERDYFQTWLKLNNSIKYQSNYNEVEHMSTELRELNERTEREDIPRAQENLGYLEEIKESLRKVVSEIETWKKEPAQSAILEDPAFLYKEETLGKWQEKYRIAFLEWKKKQQAKKD